MQKFTLEIETGNAAFDEAPASEIARILRDMADGLEQEGWPPAENCGPAVLACWNVRDINGNRVGFARVVEA